MTVTFSQSTAYRLRAAVVTSIIPTLHSSRYATRSHGQSQRPEAVRLEPGASSAGAGEQSVFPRDRAGWSRHHVLPRLSTPLKPGEARCGGRAGFAQRRHARRGELCPPR